MNAVLFLLVNGTIECSDGGCVPIGCYWYLIIMAHLTEMVFSYEKMKTTDIHVFIGACIKQLNTTTMTPFLLAEQMNAALLLLMNTRNS